MTRLDIRGFFHALVCGITLTLAAAAQAQGVSLLELAERHDSAAMLQQIRKGADVNAAAADGSTALHFAAGAGDEKAVAALIKARANVNATNRYGATPLTEAAVNPSGKVAALLIKAGANPDARMGQDETILMTAARAGNQEAVAALLGAGADVNARESRRGQTALMMAAGKGYGEIVQMLIDKGADVNAEDAPIKRDLGRVIQAGGGRLPGGKMTALLFAAREGHLDAVNSLVAGGANVNQAEAEGWTPLLLAIINTHYSVAADLVAKGADPNLANNQGLRPLYAAVEMRLPDITSRPLRPEHDAMTSLELIGVLLDKGADPNGRIMAKAETVHQPTGAAGPAAAVVLAGVGAGGTAFMRAARGGDLDAMRLLVQRGADPLATRDDKTNALMISGGVGRAGFGATAQVRSREDLLAAIKLCQDAGLDINALNADGAGAIHGAAVSGDALLVRVLADAGADLGLRNRNGLTALEVAEGKGPSVRGRMPTPQPETAAALRELLGQEKVAGNVSVANERK